MSAPALSFVVVADGFAYIRELVAALRRQTGRDRIELVVATPSARELDLDDAAVDGLEVRVVETGPTGLAEARAIGARVARAPYVFVGETHCFPQPEWSRAILAAHEEGWDAVVPVFLNGNPRGALSWSSFLLAYGRNAAPAAPLELEAVPTYNTSVRRELVPRHLDGSSGFVDVPRRGGRRFYRSAAARMDHLNVAEVRPWLDERFAIGRIFGGERSRGWSGARRAAYVAAAPALPAVYLAHVLRRTGLRRFGALPPLTLPAMCLGSVIFVAGEVTGYVLGPGPTAARRRIDEYELHRQDYAG